MPRRNTEHAKAVAAAERETRFYVAKDLKYTVPSYLIELENRISELQIAWRDMTVEEKAAMKLATIRNIRGLVRQRVVSEEPTTGSVSNVGQERDRQLDALYRAMSPEDRAKHDERAL